MPSQGAAGPYSSQTARHGAIPCVAAQQGFKKMPGLPAKKARIGALLRPLLRRNFRLISGLDRGDGLKLSLRKKKNETFLQRHGLALVTGSILLLWIVLYSVSDEKRHIGSFFGNAIADWTGVVVMVLATKYLYEQGSAESKKLDKKARNRTLEFMREHSLTVFLLLTGVGWVLLYAHADSESKWGQVVGNIVSEWTQIIGMVLLTKKLVEIGSKESQDSK
jgi:hypothetical protein